MKRFLKWNGFGWTNKIEPDESTKHIITKPPEILFVHNEDWEYSLTFPKNLYSIPRKAKK